jgi:hypothetical protein
MKPYSFYITLVGLTLVIIGVHQSSLNGVANSYWIFMFAASFLLFSIVLQKKYNLKATNTPTENKPAPKKTGAKNKPKKKR